jgi:DNA/RNA endonuclease YhcR with UshA esterase domain
MQEKHLIKLAYVFLIFGLLWLFSVGEWTTLEPITEITESKPEQTVNLQGQITALSKHGNSYFLKISGLAETTNEVILFPEENLPLKIGDHVEIRGEVEEYNGKKEIIASEIKLK